MSDEAASSRSLWAILAGVVLLALYARYLDHYGLFVIFWRGTSLSFVGRHELLLWLIHSFLVVPASLLLGWGLSEWLAARSRGLATALQQTDRSFRVAALAYFVALFVLYSLLRGLVMLDVPITDDEYSLQFGAKVWLDGSFGAPVLEPADAYPDLFTYSRDGWITSFDWPGAIAMQVAALATGLGHMLYALIAALGGLAFAGAANRWLGRRAAMLAAAVWLVSPMALTLSLTEHAHLVSRTCVAVVFYLLSVLTTTEPGRGRPGIGVGIGIGIGAVTGVGFLTRPFEVSFLLAPVAVWMVLQAVRRAPGARAALLGAVLGLIPFVALHGLYNWSVTGRVTLPPRFDRIHSNANAIRGLSVMDRIGSHLAHNLMLVMVFALGPVATWMAALAARVSQHAVAVALLSFSVVSVFALTLAHDNIGVHSVGPIHYSEAFVPIGLLFVFFVVGVYRRVKSSWWREKILACLLTYLVIALSLFSVQQLRALADQASLTSRPFAALEASGIGEAIIVAPRRTIFYPRGTSGSWVLVYPPPHRDDRWVFIKPDADLEAVRAAFPGREVFRLDYDPMRETIEFVPVER